MFLNILGLVQTYSTFYVMRKASEKFELRADSLKVETQNEKKDVYVKFPNV